MLISLKDIISRYSINIRGVLHIGAHYGEEYYGGLDVIYFEPVKDNFRKLIQLHPDAMAFNIALGNESGTRVMYVETDNNGQSCSLLEPAVHLTQYPNIVFNQKEIVRIDRLDNVPFNRDEYNMINMDVQGFELEVLKGGIKTLRSIDYIYSEVNFVEMYKGCCLVEELDGFLLKHGFSRVMTDDSPVTWGDAFYMR